MLNRLMVATLGATLLFLLGGGRLALADEPMVRLQANQPPDLTYYPGATPAPQETTMYMRAYFAFRNKQQFDQLGQDLQDPSSPRYHKWLTPQQLNARFGPHHSDFEAVVRWLSSQGFKIEDTDRRAPAFVGFSGTVGQVEKVFDLTIYSVDGPGKHTY